MSADPIIYCLERVSDYRDFERLCSALLSGAGYPQIDPFGGTGDKGRDAVIRSDASGRKIVFAYTVRADWQVKLTHDCQRVRDEKHNPDLFVFVCTEALSANDKDLAQKIVSEKFGWMLELFDLERIRVQLVGPQRHLIAQHPSIFIPPFFPQRGGQSVSESRDSLLIDHVPADHALATWLARRLSLAGYRTWCSGTAPLAGDSPDDTVRALLDTRAAQYLPVVSAASLADRIFLERCAIAAARGDFVIPCSLAPGQHDQLPSKLAKVAPATFADSWDQGLRQTLARLTSVGVNPELDAERGRQIALRDYLPTRVTTAKPERVFANVFGLQVPALITVYDLQHLLTEAEWMVLQTRWAFAMLNSNQVAAFAPPPAEARSSVALTQAGEFLWADFPKRQGKRTVDIAKQLARRSLELACVAKGLEYCGDRRVYYFPAKQSAECVQTIEHVDGRSTTVNLTGMRTKGWGDRASPFHYQLAPIFNPNRDESGTWSVCVSVYVRTTTLDGKVFEGKEIGRRRKIVGKSWWNQQWLARLLGVVQALQTSPGQIVIGEGNQAVIMQTKPLEWECPVGLDVLALSGMTDIGEEIAGFRWNADDEGDADSTEGEPAS